MSIKCIKNDRELPQSNLLLGLEPSDARKIDPYERNFQNVVAKLRSSYFVMCFDSESILGRHSHR